ncbi:phosphatase PAP2 family protein [bacterium]|nr:phosphatase PAP2 family protein [bacterium]
MISTLAGFKAAIQSIDAIVFKVVHGSAGHPVMDHVMLAATWMGVGIIQTGLSLAFIIFGWYLDRVNLRRAGYAGLLAFAASGIAVQIGKFIWDRPRPLLSLFDVRIVDGPLFTHSFPSGHTTTAFAVAFACSVFLPRFRYVLIPMAFITALSRVYCGVHYPLDVTYGGLIGALIGLAMANYVRSFNTRNQELDVYNVM